MVGGVTTLVTGGAGFIGSHLVEKLLHDGPVVVLDNFNDFYDPERKEANLAVARARPGFTLERGDLRDAALVRGVLRRHRIDSVVHLAAFAGVRPSVENARQYVQNNLEGTQSMLDACVEHRVERLVFASSSSVYGNAGARPSREDSPADRPVSPYAATKRAGELLCHATHATDGLHVTCLRFFSAVGPRQRPDLAVHKFARLVRQGAPLTLFGDGTSERDYTHVLDLVDGISSALERCKGFDVINLGAGQPVRLIDLVRHIGNAVGREPRIEFEPMQRGDVDATMADLTRARDRLGYAPRRGIELAVRDLCDWLEQA